MVTIDPLVLALISAGGGALVSSVFAVFVKSFELWAKRKEVIFNAAIAQAKQRVATVLEVCKINGASGALPDETLLTGVYYKWLEHLYDHGSLPKEAIEAERKSQAEFEENRKQAAERARILNQPTVDLYCKSPSTARQLLASTEVRHLNEEQITQLEQAAKLPDDDE